MYDGQRRLSTDLHQHSTWIHLWLQSRLCIKFRRCQLHRYVCIQILCITVDSIMVLFSDVNECQLNNGNCEQGCTNTEGGFFCTCMDGFFLFNATHCRGMPYVSTITITSFITTSLSILYMSRVFGWRRAIGRLKQLQRRKSRGLLQWDLLLNL